MIGKIKIKDLAAELGVIYAELIPQVNQQFALEIKGPMSVVDEEDANRIREWMHAKGSQFAIEEKRVASRVIRRRRVNVEHELTSEEVAADPALHLTDETHVAVKLTSVPTNGHHHDTEPAIPTALMPSEMTTAKPASPASSSATEPLGEANRRIKGYQTLKIVQASPIHTPQVREAPVFAQPRIITPSARDTRTPEQIARDEMSASAGGAGSPTTVGRPSLSRREIVEVRNMTRGKPYSKKKAKKGEGKKTEITTPKATKRVIKITGVVTISDLAKHMAVKVGELIGKAMGMGMMVTINQSIDPETAAILASEFGYEIENVELTDETLLQLEQEGAATGELKPRPPVVTVMGHVDHGKTSLLDAIRKANVAGGEFGGITQHIGAYDVKHSKGHIVFLDTPGHEAFTAMRARGAQVTDIVVLVVAADDGVMPQTKESINHSKAAKVPIIVVVNKIDKPGVNPDRIKQDLTEFSLVPEEWGGDTMYAHVSAKTGQGVSELLDMILLQAEVLELKADPTRHAIGTIVESQLDRGRGAVATVLVQQGTLHVGDAVVCGAEFGKVRSLVNDRGERIHEAGPSIPAEVIGLSGVVQVGDRLHVVKDEKTARQISEMRQQKVRTKNLDSSSKMSLEALYNQIEQGEVKELKVVVKADVMGSSEAIAETLKKLGDPRVNVNIIHNAVGGITEGDVMLASASKALIIGFNIRPDSAMQQLAEKQGVQIRLYTIIYDIVDDIKKAMQGLLAPKEVEKVLGHIAIREVFTISKVGAVGGGSVTDGRVTRGCKVRLLRDNVLIHTGTLGGLKRFKDDAKEVKEGLECGISIENFNDIKPGDIVEAYTIEQVAQTLE